MFLENYERINTGTVIVIMSLYYIYMYIYKVYQRFVFDISFVHNLIYSVADVDPCVEILH